MQQVAYSGLGQGMKDNVLFDSNDFTEKSKVLFRNWRMLNLNNFAILDRIQLLLYQRT